jgi:eukaryotic-like serine/threonine-protein kinase
MARPDHDTQALGGDADPMVLPPTLVGCFPGDPEDRIHAVLEDDWLRLDLEIPRDVFPAPVTPLEDSPLEALIGAEVDMRETRRFARPDFSLPALGSVIDKYRLEELIGTGGFAAVYRATHLLLRISVALKLLKPEVIVLKPFLAELLCEEARFAAQLNHPNVVRVFDVTHTPQITYIIMEFIDGQSLMEVIQAHGALGIRRVLQIGIDVARGLQAANAQGMIHRDIKPANILMTHKGLAKIVDLGLAVQQRSADRKGPDGDTVVGTPAYMAPEQASTPDQVDFRADIYSLGVTLYHAALGRPPFQGKTPLESISLHQTEPVPSPQDIVPNFPFELSRMLLWMLEKDPGARPASYDHLIEGLEEALQAASFAGS